MIQLSPRGERGDLPYPLYHSWLAPTCRNAAHVHPLHCHIFTLSPSPNLASGHGWSISTKLLQCSQSFSFGAPPQPHGIIDIYILFAPAECFVLCLVFPVSACVHLFICHFFEILKVVFHLFQPLPGTPPDILYYGVTGIYALWCHASFSPGQRKGIYTLAA